MRLDSTVPRAFSLEFIGPEGPYRADFSPGDGWEGEIAVTIGGIDMIWTVDAAVVQSGGTLTLGGTTTGTRLLWQDVFWFELKPCDEPPAILYWGNQILWRKDSSVSQSPSP